ncbi:hypothetical protein V1525DRAFT_399677 [Lipomyces kononenkoae]|uniref:Uncharacterized protein n=1 Tax=Lipomyces kononenkoae TaxID=34357 RepID=A0ACC3T4M7_LIPKO
MTSRNPEPETTEAKEFSNELDQIFGLGEPKGVFNTRSSSMINQQNEELSTIAQQLRATEERLRRRREEFEEGMVRPTSDIALGKNEGSIGTYPASPSVPRRVPRKSLEKSPVSASLDASDILYNPRSRPSSNGHTIRSSESGSSNRDASQGDQSRKTSIGAIGAKMQSWTKHRKQEKVRRASPSASDSSTISSGVSTANEGKRLPSLSK